MYNRILVTTDGSTLSKKAVAHAIQLAALSGAELIALRVTPRYPQSYFEGICARNSGSLGRVMPSSRLSATSTSPPTGPTTVRASR